MLSLANFCSPFLLKDQSLKHTLQFGIGMHHAGLSESDRSIVENLFSELKIQVLVATSTLAWGVNTPAHLVVIKVSPLNLLYLLPGTIV